MTILRVAVLVSDRGAILKAMINAGVPIDLVIADKHCEGSRIAVAANIPYKLVHRNPYGYCQGAAENWKRAEFTRQIIIELRRAHIDVVVMDGFATILHPIIFQHFAGRILNIHLSLLPDYPGQFALRDMVAKRETVAGSTMHIATEVPDDTTSIVAVSRGVNPGRYEDETHLAGLIESKGAEVFPQVVLDILSGKLDLDAIYHGR